MPTADALISEAILRVEHKVDAILRFINPSMLPMHFIGLSCPVCMMPIDYTVDIQAGIAVRRCNCKTGKVAATIPLMPVDPGVASAPEPYQSVEPEEPVRSRADQSSRGAGRKAR